MYDIHMICHFERCVQINTSYDCFSKSRAFVIYIPVTMYICRPCSKGGLELFMYLHQRASPGWRGEERGGRGYKNENKKTGIIVFH